MDIMGRSYILITSGSLTVKGELKSKLMQFFFHHRLNSYIKESTSVNMLEIY